MTFKDLAKKLNASVQTVPNLVKVLADAFNVMEGGGSSDIEYSTTEQKIGKWIDGSDLYEKTVVLEAVTGGIKTLWTDASVIIVEFNGLFKSRSANTVLSLYSRPNDASYKTCVTGLGNTTSNNIYADVDLGTSRSGLFDLVLTIRYTKSA